MIYVARYESNLKRREVRLGGYQFLTSATFQALPMVQVGLSTIVAVLFAWSKRTKKSKLMIQRFFLLAKYEAFA